MGIYEINGETISPLGQTTFKKEGLLEQKDLQRLVRNSISVISPNTMVIDEEFSDWEDSHRRIDLLCLDREANLIVVELKRNSDGGHMELQAIRYAAMVSALTFSKVVQAHQSYLDKLNKEEDAEEEILKFLDLEEPDEDTFGQEVKIVLASADFSKEITTAVIWLNTHDVDIRCVRLRPYNFNNQILLDVQQIIPLPEAAEYQVKIREKETEIRISRKDNRDLTRFDLTINGEIFTNLPKRRLIYHVVSEALKNGGTPDSLQKMMPGNRRWLVVDGECAGADFHNKAKAIREERGVLYEPRRYFNDDDELFHISGRTYALTKMWGLKTTDVVNKILETFPKIQAHYNKSVIT